MSKRNIVSGSFGSAGSSRSLRRTSTRAGSAHTATVMGLKPDRLDLNLGAVPVAEIWEAIRTQQCCFCADTRTFTALSQHWVFGHGFDLQDIRDKLGVPKGYSFISKTLSQTYKERGARLYNPDKLKNSPAGTKRHTMSEYGIAANRAKLDAIPNKEGNRKKAKEARIANAAKQREAYENDHPCVVCGKVFTRTSTWHATVCSRECNRKRASLKHPGEFPTMRKPRTCKVCGIIYELSKALTCSEECRRINRSNQARLRKPHLDRIRAERLRTMALRPPRLCTVASCTKAYMAKGMCSPHYQQVRVDSMTPSEREQRNAKRRVTDSTASAQSR